MAATSALTLCFRRKPLESLRQQRAEHAVEEFPKIHRRSQDVEPPGLEFGVVQNVVQYPPERLARLAGQPDHALLLGRQRRLLQQFNQAENAIHWRADLMAHHGQETVLGSRCRFGRILCLRQHLGTLPVFREVRIVAMPQDTTIGLCPGHSMDANPACLSADQAAQILAQRLLLHLRYVHCRQQPGAFFYAVGVKRRIGLADQ
jgi:hypothetical protein